MLAHEGCTLVLTARRKDRLDSLADEIEQRGYIRPSIIVQDIMAKGAADAMGPLQALVLGLHGCSPTRAALWF